MTTEAKKYYCTRPRLYSILVQSGYLPIDIVPHFTQPKYHCWVFEETPELREIVENYFTNI